MLRFQLTISLLLLYSAVLACSVCKVTINGHTYLGSNEDNWRLGSRIWFETAKPGQLGCVFVGFGEHPQGGMNEAGLAFDGLATLPKKQKALQGKKFIANATDFLKMLLHRCHNVEEVKQLAERYNRQELLRTGEYIFADRQGNYLVMEPDTILTGHDNRYLISNFCPSITPEQEKRSLGRYLRGARFLEDHPNDTSAGFCFALTDTMHECRKRIGDGTMYSYVADLDRGLFTLCFYHDFKHPIVFNLANELAKGDHSQQLDRIFPGNAEYQRFLAYQTPRNNRAMLLYLFIGGALFAFAALYFLLSAATSSMNNGPSRRTKLLLAALAVTMLYYTTVLYAQEGVYYFDAPFQDYRFSMLTIAAYIPFLLLAVLIPLVRKNVIVWQRREWPLLPTLLFSCTNLFYLGFTGLFFYWGLYQVF